MANYEPTFFASAHFNKRKIMKKTISLLLAIVLLVSTLTALTSCKNGDEKKESYQTLSKTVSYVHFNTVSSIHSYGDTSVDEFDLYVKKTDELLEKYHKLFDIYYEYSGINNIKTINRNAGKTAVKVDKELIDFLVYCKELYTLTKGKTNVMLGSVLKIWHNCREEASYDFGYLNPEKLPTKERLEEANEHTSIDLLVIDEQASTVYISDPGASIDVGAIGKGYATQKLCDTLVSLGADNMALNIGGNLRTIGLKPGGEPWVTGITNPDKSSAESLVCRVEIGSTSMVTSGDYERFFYAGDTKYHHVIDPDTLMPAAYFSSVSIITDMSGFADALSTALFCMSYEDGLALVESIGGIEVIWIDLDYNMKTTPGVKILPLK